MAYPIGPRVTAALLLGAALVAGCKSGGDRGYERVVSRNDPAVPAHQYPDPPEVVPGTSIGAAPAKVVATNLPAGVTQAMVDEGQELYGGVCVGCHGQNAVGSPAGPSLADAQWLNISGQYPEIVTIINNGVPNPKQYPGMMPPRGGGSYNEQQVRSIAAYVYALSHQGG